MAGLMLFFMRRQSVKDFLDQPLVAFIGMEILELWPNVNKHEKVV